MQTEQKNFASNPSRAEKAHLLGLRALPCPFPSALNPHVEAASCESFIWLEQSGMLTQRATIDKLRRAKTGWLVARTNPLVSHKMLRLLTDWYNWLFAFDDGFCERSETGGRAAPLVLMLPRLLRVLDGDDASCSADPFARALWSVRQRIAQDGSAEQLGRFCMAVKEYLFAQVWEAGNRESGRVPSLSDYLLMRRTTGATYTCLALIDVASGYSLSATEWFHPIVAELGLLAVDLVGFDNDLISYVKEYQHDSARHNLVTVLAVEHICSVSGAIEKLALLHCTALDRFLAQKTALGDWASDGVLRYVAGLEHWVRGHIDWSLESSRFHSDPQHGI